MIQKHLFSTFLFKILGYIISFIGSIFLVRILGAEGVGIRTILVANATLLATFFGFNLKSAIAYFTANKEISTNSVIHQVSRYNLISFIIIITFAIVVNTNALPIELRKFIIGDRLNIWLLVFLSVLSLNTIIENVTQGFWIGLKKFMTLNLVLLFTPLAIFLVFGYWYIFNDKNGMLIAVFQVLTVIYVINSLISISILAFKSKLKLNTREEDKQLPKLFSKYVFSTYLITGSNILTKRLDVWIIQYFVGLNQLGYYGLATSLTDIFIALLIPVSHVLGPYITEGKKELYQPILLRYCRFTVLLGVIVFLGFLILSPFIINLLYGVEWENSIPPLRILSIGVLFLLLRNIFSVYFNSIHNLRPIIISNIVAMTCTIIFGLLVIPKWGIGGASIVSILSYMASCSILGAFFFKSSKLSIKEAFIIKKQDISLLQNEIIKVFNRNK